MSVSNAPTLASMSIAVAQARLEAGVDSRTVPRGAAPPALTHSPAPQVQISAAAQQAEAMGRQLEQSLTQERRALEQMQAVLRSLPRHDPVIGRLLDLSA